MERRDRARYFTSAVFHSRVSGFESSWSLMVARGVGSGSEHASRPRAEERAGVGAAIVVVVFWPPGRTQGVSGMSDDDRQWLTALVMGLPTQIEGPIQSIDAQIQGIETQIHSIETRLLERIELTETRLLTAFHQFAAPMEARVKSHSSLLRALDLELESNLDAIKARLDQLEGGRRNQEQAQRPAR